MTTGSERGGRPSGASAGGGPPAGPAPLGPPAAGTMGMESRRLLRRIRDIMAGSGSAQDRLDQIVSVVAADFVAEVCSIYLRRAGNVLELFASQGLKSEAVHMTRLRVGEGLVGDIAAHARPLALSDAQSHPAFAYRPETGEEIYHSLVGVPVLRDGRLLGVIVVQNRTQRHYREEEVETLETVATVLAELVARGDLVPLEELHIVEGIAVLPQRLEGLRINGGIGWGQAVLHRPQFRIDRIVAENPAEEIARLDGALVDVKSALDALFDKPILSDKEGEHTEILDTYRMFADDRGWTERIKEVIRSGLTAEAATQKIINDTRARMGQVGDAYLRERLADLEDLGNRVLSHLTGAGPGTAEDLPEDIILVARTMGPAEILDYEGSRVRGLILEEGSQTAHVSVIARALNIPVIGRVSDAFSRIDPGDPIILDGDHSQAFIRPSEDIQDAFEELAHKRAQQLELYAGLRDLPPVTADGINVSISLNANLLQDVEALNETGAEGIGLYRTEIHFMAQDRYPDVDSQVDLYARIFEIAADRPVRFRTLDVGGDKGLPYWPGIDEDNPSMGWRSIRIALDRPAMLRHQVRALIIAAAGRPLHIMLPMITEMAEFYAAKKIITKEVKRAHERGDPVPDDIRLGVMLEVPALFWQLPVLLPHLDFLSVGTNDLFQFLFASDRGNPRMADRYDVLSPTALRFLKDLVGLCEAARVPVTICGEMAGRTLEAMTLVGLGFRSLSMGPHSVGPIRAMVRSLRADQLSRYLETLLTLPDHSLREKLRAFAHDHKIVV
ncbi:MAG: phosphoenolpyruvate--protein phosphotransferase [Alphaproteobacteria bacterium]